MTLSEQDIAFYARKGLIYNPATFNFDIYFLDEVARSVSCELIIDARRKGDLDKVVSMIKSQFIHNELADRLLRKV